MSASRRAAAAAPAPEPGGWLARVASVFVAPVPASTAAGTSPASLSAVLCRPADAAWAAPTAAAALAGRSGEPVVAVLLGPGAPPAWGRPASRRARGLAASLIRRGLDASTAGGLVLVRLSDDVAAHAAVQRAAAAAPGPVVVVCTAPRSGAVDRLLAGLDVVAAVLAPGTPANARAIVRQSLAGLGVPCAVLEAPPPGLERLAGQSGLGSGRAAGRVRAALREAS